MMPREIIQEAVESMDYLFDRNIITKKCHGVVTDILKLHLQAAGELPERRIIGTEDFKCGGCGECEGCKHYRDYGHYEDIGFNACLESAIPILARKNEELAMLKKENEELEQELEACRDANVQKKKRIAELEDALKRAEGK